jgi:hypothetical protein
MDSGSLSNSVCAPAAQRQPGDHSRGRRSLTGTAPTIAAPQHARQLAELRRQLGAANHEIEVLRSRLATDPALTDHG